MDVLKGLIGWWLVGMAFGSLCYDLTDWWLCWCEYDVFGEGFDWLVAFWVCYCLINFICGYDYRRNVWFLGVPLVGVYGDIWLN